MNDIREMVISNFSNATYVENFRLYEDGTLKKRNGCTYLAKFDAPVRAMIHDTGKRIYIVSGNALYYYEDGALNYFMYIDGAVFSDDNEKCFMFIYAGTLYIIGGGIIFTVHLSDGNIYYEVNAGYVPTIASASERYSAESFNLLRNRVREYCIIDASQTYELNMAASEIFSVKIGETVLSSNEYAGTNNGNGKYELTISNTSHLISGEIMEIEYSVAERKYTIEHEHFLKCNRSFVFEGENESYLMLYNTEQGYIYYSKARKDENGNIVDGDYFPYENKFLINGGLAKICAVIEFLGRVVVLTRDGMYNIVEENAKDSAGNAYKTFRITAIDTQFGASANSGVQVFENELYFMNSLGLYRVMYNPVECKYTKKRIEIPDGMRLSPKELDSAFLHIDRIHREVWCIIEDKIAVYNITSKRWYYFTGFHPERCLISDNYTVFVSDMAICKFDPEASDDFGNGFDTSVQTGNIDFGNIFAKKTVYGFGVSFERCEGAVLDCTFTSDNGDTFSFSVSSDDDNGDTSPIVKRMHARFSRCSYLLCRVASKKGTATANLKELMFRYRIIN